MEEINKDIEHKEKRFQNKRNPVCEFVEKKRQVEGTRYSVQDARHKKLPNFRFQKEIHRHWKEYM
jgi:hypothetical protein